MLNIEIQKSKPHILVETVDYVPNSVGTKTLKCGATGNVIVVAVDAGESLAE